MTHIPTLADYEACGLERILGQVERKICAEYSDALVSGAREAEDRGDQASAAALLALGAVASLTLRADAVKDTEVFTPGVVIRVLDVQGARRPYLAQVADVRSAEVGDLAQYACQIDDPELKARVADYLWTRRGKRAGTDAAKMGSEAVAAYRETAERLRQAGEWMEGPQRIARAFRLARNLGDRDLSTVCAYVERVLSMCKEVSDDGLARQLLALLVETKDPAYSHYASVARARGQGAEGDASWDFARAFYEIEEGLHKLAGDKAGALDARRRQIATYAGEAGLLRNAGGCDAIRAISRLKDGIVALRRLGARKADIDPVYQVLCVVQQEFADAMPQYEVSHDATPLVKLGRDAVSGKPLLAALIGLVGIADMIPAYDDLRASAKDALSEDVLQDIFHVEGVCSKGRTRTRRTALDESAPESEREKAILAEMHDQAKAHRDRVGGAVVRPALDVVLKEHSPRLEDLAPIVLHSAFVPAGRGWLFARGLFAGLYQDWATAGHLLMPQVENALRVLLEKAGCVTSSMGESGLQQEGMLGPILLKAGGADVLDRDVIFALRSLLVKDDAGGWGSNLRNDIAHGLLDSEQACSAQVTYLWWLALYLCCFFLTDGTHAEEPAATPEGPGTARDDGGEE